MKIRKILAGFTAGAMAVSSAIVCPIVANAVDTTLLSAAEIASWTDTEIYLSAAGIANGSSQLEISCPLPDGAEDGYQLFNVIADVDGGWDDPVREIAVDTSQTVISTTIDVSELDGASKIFVQAGVYDIKVTVEALNFDEDTREEVTVATKQGMILLNSYQDEWNEGTMANADVPVSSVSGVDFGKTTVKELKDSIKTLSASANPVYTDDSLDLGKDAYSYAVWLHMQNSSGEEEWNRGDLVSFDEIATLSTDTLDSRLDDYAIVEIGLTYYPQIEELSNGKNQAVNETIRNLTPGTQIIINESADTRKAITVPSTTGSIVLYTFQDEWNEGTMACAEVPASSVSGIDIGTTTIKELKDTVKTISASAKPVYNNDSLNLGKDAYTYAVWMHMQNSSGEEGWWRGDLVSFDEIASLYTETIDSRLDDYAIVEIGLTFYPKMVKLSNGKSQAVSEVIRNLEPEDRIFINNSETTEDDEDDLKYDGLGEVKAEGTRIVEVNPWAPEDADCTVLGFDPDWVKTKDDTIIIKVKYNKAYFDPWTKLAFSNFDSNVNEENTNYEFAESDFNVHVRVETLLKQWGYDSVQDLQDKPLSIQLWMPEVGDSIDYQVSVISPVFEQEEVTPEEDADFVPPTIEKMKPNKTYVQTTGKKKNENNEDVFDARFVMAVPEATVNGKGRKLVAYITIKRLSDGKTTTISTSICYDSVSAIGDKISADDGEKLLAFAILDIPEGEALQYTSFIINEAE